MTIRAPTSLATLGRSPGSSMSVAWPRVNDVAARLDPRPSLDHHQPGPLADMVVAQLLTCAEAGG